MTSLYKINLLPWRDALAREKNEIFIFICIVLFALTSAVIFGIFKLHKNQIDYENQKLIFINREIDKLKEELKSVKVLDKKKKSLADRTQIIGSLQKLRPFTVFFFEEMVRTLPADGLWIKDLKLNENLVEIKGAADLTGRITAYVNELRKSYIIERPNLTEVINQANDSVEFYLFLNLNPASFDGQAIQGKENETIEYQPAL